MGVGPDLPVLPAAPEPEPEPEPEPDPDPDPVPDPEPELEVLLPDPNPPDGTAVPLAIEPVPVAYTLLDLTAVDIVDEAVAEAVAEEEDVLKTRQQKIQFYIGNLMTVTYTFLQLKSYNGVVLAEVITPKLGLGVVPSASSRVYQ